MMDMSKQKIIILIKNIKLIVVFIVLYNGYVIIFYILQEYLLLVYEIDLENPKGVIINLKC